MCNQEHNPGNWKREHGFLASATHMCARAVTDLGLGSLLTPQTCVGLWVVCVCVSAREETTRSHKSQQHPRPQYTSHLQRQHTSVQSHTLEHHTKSSMCNQATRIVTTGSLLLQHTCVRTHTHCPRASSTCIRNAHACVMRHHCKHDKPEP